MFCRVYWYLLTDVSGKPISHDFKGQTLEYDCPETSVTANLRCVTSQKSDDLLVLKLKFCILRYMLIICGYSRINFPLAKIQ